MSSKLKQKGELIENIERKKSMRRSEDLEINQLVQSMQTLGLEIENLEMTDLLLQQE